MSTFFEKLFNVVVNAINTFFSRVGFFFGSLLGQALAFMPSILSWIFSKFPSLTNANNAVRQAENFIDSLSGWIVAFDYYFAIGTFFSYLGIQLAFYIYYLGFKLFLRVVYLIIRIQGFFL